ncbi:MAG: hypothetical protein IKL02_01820 [Kiritimatiellae bacterium]|nr:hypothetical protein [Kiritimatiellia bacterium]
MLGLLLHCARYRMLPRRRWRRGFVRPPNAAKPHTWYRMTNGNIAKEGITRDFKALAKAGVGERMRNSGPRLPILLRGCMPTQGWTP